MEVVTRKKRENIAFYHNLHVGTSGFSLSPHRGVEIMGLTIFIPALFEFFNFGGWMSRTDACGLSVPLQHHP